jgi:hypothetical protein
MFKNSDHARGLRCGVPAAAWFDARKLKQFMCNSHHARGLTCVVPAAAWFDARN